MVTHTQIYLIQFIHMGVLRLTCVFQVIISIKSVICQDWIELWCWCFAHNYVSTKWCSDFNWLKVTVWFLTQSFPLGYGQLVGRHFPQLHKRFEEGTAPLQMDQPSPPLMKNFLVRKFPKPIKILDSFTQISPRKALSLEFMFCLESSKSTEYVLVTDCFWGSLCFLSLYFLIFVHVFELSMFFKIQNKIIVLICWHEW